MNQEQNNLNTNNFNTQGNNGIPNNQPLQNNTNLNSSVNQTIYNSQLQSTFNYQQPINQASMQQTISQPTNNTFENGSVNNPNSNKKPTKKINLGLLIGIVGIVVVTIGAGIYAVLNANSSKQSNPNNEQLNKAPSDYISIKTVDDYEKLINGTYDLSKNYILMADLDLKDYCNENKCIPIGLESKEGFTGIFDGNNHIISNYYFNINDIKISNYYSDETLYGIGIFSKISNGTIKNLILKNSIIEISDYDNYGTPIGLLSGIANNVLIDNCDINGTIKTNDSINKNIYSIGLLFGELNMVDDLNSNLNDETINTGYNTDYHIISKIINVKTSGSINISSSLNVNYIGGMIGKTTSSYHNKFGYAIFNAIENCSSNVELLLSSTSGDNYKDISYVGGLIGNSDSDYVYRSSSSGNIECNNSYNVAGFIGASHTSKIDQCYSTSNVKSGKGASGFIENYNSSTGVEEMGVTNSYYKGDVTCTEDDEFFPCTLFIGNVGDTISNNYAFGTTNNKNSKVNRFNAYNQPLVENTNYCNSDIINEKESECTKLTSTQMLEEKSYNGFDFENTWNIDEGKTTPQLKWNSK